MTTTLREMAELQRQGQPHKPEHLAFINQAVDTMPSAAADRPACKAGTPTCSSSPRAPLDFDPTIADVHTQPTDEAGNPVGHVLHVGTGWARLMVTTVDTCMGPRAYAGVVYSYHEQITKDLRTPGRPEWSRAFTPDRIPADVPWMTDLVVK